MNFPATASHIATLMTNKARDQVSAKAEIISLANTFELTIPNQEDSDLFLGKFMKTLGKVSVALDEEDKSHIKELYTLSKFSVQPDYFISRHENGRSINIRLNIKLSKVQGDDNYEVSGKLVYVNVDLSHEWWWNNPQKELQKIAGTHFDMLKNVEV